MPALRETVRLLVAAGVPELAGRVYEPEMAAPQEPLPFAIVQEGPRTAPPDWEAYTLAFDVFLFADQLTFQTLDTLEQETTDALDGTVVLANTRRYLLSAMGTTGGDQTITEREPNAIVRTVRVTAYYLGWLKGDTYNRAQPLALRTWLATVEPGAQSDPAIWNPNDEAPAVYWRFERVISVEKTNYGGVVSAQLNGHVLAPSGDVQTDWALRLAERLTLTPWLELSNNGGPMEIIDVRADTSADPFTVGQLQLQVEYGLLDGASTAPPMQVATFHVNGAVVVIPPPSA